MANINSTLDTTIWSEDGQTAVTVNELSTGAIGLSVSPVGVYFSSDPTLSDTQVYPLRVSASGNLLTESSVYATDLDIRDLDEAQDSIRAYSASGSPSFEVYNIHPQKTILTDADGNDVNINADGSLQVTFATGGSSITRMIELRYETTVGLNTVDTWYDVMEYAVPSGYSLELIDFSSLAENNTSSARAMTALSLGEYNIATSVFSDGSSYTMPYFGAVIEAHLHTAVVGATTLTITYTNVAGTAGRTATVNIPNGSIAGESFIATLQGTDRGATDITNVTKTGGTSGEIHLHGIVTVFREKMTSSSQTYHQITSRESIIIGQGETLTLGIKSDQKAAVKRYVHVLGQLRSIVED